jgi:cobyrinic acid a,c-diamide synthase
MRTRVPRLVIAGTAGDSGKTLVTLSLLSAWRAEGVEPAAFKKGPDYIDAAWLGWAAGAACRNLDTYLQPSERLLAAFCRHAAAGVSVVEGNRGLSDGVDLQGTHSTASLARLLRAPVFLVVNAAKVTRTVAALVLGCQRLEPDLQLAGVILNRVSGARHEGLTRRAVEELAGVPVIGVLPRITEELLPGRHLGLVPPQEHHGAQEILGKLGELARQHVDLERLLAIAREAPVLAEEGGTVEGAAKLSRPAPKVRIGVFWDSAFTFYYPENLEALREAGAELVYLSGLDDRQLPAVDALYLGGGFPETHAPRLADNVALHRQLREAAEAGLPIYAECGGLIYLARTLRVGKERHVMAGVLPLDLELCARPVGHGYVELTADRENPFFARGQTLTGHEFHYTRIVEPVPDGIDTAFAVRRGTGSIEGRDGILHKNVMASYTHLHAVGAPEWAVGVVKRAQSGRQLYPF